MPLSHAVDRDLIHTRRLHMESYRRADGNYDIEGHIDDVKPFPYVMLDSRRAAGEPLHDMWLRLTISPDMEVIAAEASMDVGAHFPCQEVAPNFARLAGLKIGPGWKRRVHERVGHGAGCTHLIEMLAQMATVAYQSMYSERKKEGQGDQRPEDRRMQPGLLNSCYAYSSDSPFVRDYFPSQYKVED
ncbi:MAG: DUF2889 domain-containing protein [Rhodobacterales bacterium]|nr:DUF2889 domain-containing protein [Rhodobacterales bacterium]